MKKYHNQQLFHPWSTFVNFILVVRPPRTSYILLSIHKNSPLSVHNDSLFLQHNSLCIPIYIFKYALGEIFRWIIFNFPMCHHHRIDLHQKKKTVYLFSKQFTIHTIIPTFSIHSLFVKYFVTLFFYFVLWFLAVWIFICIAKRKIIVNKNIWFSCGYTIT